MHFIKRKLTDGICDDFACEVIHEGRQRGIQTVAQIVASSGVGGRVATVEVGRLVEDR